MYLKEAKKFISQFPQEELSFSGCSEQEILHLQNYLNVKVPTAFKEFLSWFGKSGGQTMAGTHFYYRYISDEYFNEMIEEEIIEEGTSMKTWAKDLMMKCGFEPSKHLTNTIVFMYDPIGSFHFIKTDKGENPAVYVFSRGESSKEVGPQILNKTFGEYILQILKVNIEEQKQLRRIK